MGAASRQRAGGGHGLLVAGGIQVSADRDARARRRHATAESSENCLAPTPAFGGARTRVPRRHRPLVIVTVIASRCDPVPLYSPTAVQNPALGQLTEFREVSGLAAAPGGGVISTAGLRASDNAQTGRSGPAPHGSPRVP